ncbi:unnamed protein product, partial [marine sediment metagenome]
TGEGVTHCFGAVKECQRTIGKEFPRGDIGRFLVLQQASF